MEFIHYGSNEFKPELVQFKNPNKADNPGCLNKPSFGLWASPIGDEYYTWEEFCEGFNMDSFNKSFSFTLADNAKILKINSIDEWSYFCNQFGKIPDYDYEKQCELKVKIWDNITKNFDAFFLYYSNFPGWDLNFSSWDVDSLVVFNHDVVILS